MENYRRVPERAIKETVRQFLKHTDSKTTRKNIIHSSLIDIDASSARRSSSSSITAVIIGH